VRGLQASDSTPQARNRPQSAPAMPGPAGTILGCNRT
jgi:hypothetical protein